MSWISLPTLARTATLAVALSAWAAVDTRAATIDFSWSGANGYSATGNFTYDAATAPTLIAESGAGATKTVQSFFITFFDPARAVLETGSSVIAGVSSDRFFRLNYNTLTNAISSLDADIGGSYFYFLTNLRTPTGGVVPAGQTTFNFFDRRTANAALDTAPTITAQVVQTVAVPEPSALALMATAMLSLLALRRRMG